MTHKHTRSNCWFIRFVGMDEGRWVCANTLHTAKWLFADAEGVTSISRIQGSKYGPTTDTF